MFNANSYEKNISPFLVRTTQQIFSDYGHVINWPNKQKNRSEVMKILDAGCGEGSSTINTFQEFVMKNVENYRIFGVDFSEEMVLKAREKYKDEKNCEFELMDLSLENFPDKFIETFDLIYSMYSLHWVETTYWIQNFYRMLKPSGQLFLVVAISCKLIESFLVVNKREKFCKYQEPSVWDKPFFMKENVDEWIKSLLKKEGYKNITVKYINVYLKLPNRSFLTSLIKSFNTAYSNLPTSLIDDYINEVADQIIKELVKDFDSSSSSEMSIRKTIMLIFAEK